MRKLLIALSFFAATAQAQYCAGYARQYNITIQPGAIAGTLANYTMLVSGTYAGGAAVADLRATGSGGGSLSSGNDITFNQAGTPLTWNMPIYIGATGQVKANVLIPSATVGTTVAMCVGKAGMAAPTGKAYDSFTQMALQFPSANLVTDSTGIQSVTNVGGATHTSTGPTYLVDAMALTGANYLDLGSASSFAYGANYRTITFWENLSSTAIPLYFISYGVSGTPNGGFSFGTGDTHPYVYLETNSIQASTGTLVTNSWHRWDVVLSSATAILYYLDGVLTNAVNQKNPNTQVGTAFVGRFTQFNGWNVIGQMAEVRAVNIDRTAAWIAAEYLNQTNPPTFYGLSVPPGGPTISNVSVVANSPLSVKAIWTTDLASDSQVRCGPTQGLYPFVSNVVDPNPAWNVTSHSMASNPMPNGSYYCIVVSTLPSGAVSYSAEQPLVVLPAMPVSVPIAMISRGGHRSKLGDRWAGINGAPITGAWNAGDQNYFTWADDGNEYISSNDWLGVTTPFGSVKFTDSLHTNGTPLGMGWQGGHNNIGYTNVGIGVSGYPVIAIKGSVYNWMFGNAGGLMRTTDYYNSTIGPNHNVGPDTTYITNMTCAAGRVTATSKLNVTDQLALIVAPGKLAMYIAGATGTNVNGIFGGNVSATSATISWDQTCATWAWNPAGGTGSGGGTINIYGWDVPYPSAMSYVGEWVQNDGPGYTNGTHWAGMDAFVYWYAAYPGMLCRMRVEDFPQQNAAKVTCYRGKQLGDDGIYDSNWSAAGPFTVINKDQFALMAMGRGASAPQAQYLTDLHRYVWAYDVTGFNPSVDSDGGGTAIYDGGLYPWSPLTLIGDAQRRVDTYMWNAPEFPQFVAKSQTASGGVTSINLSHAGGNFGVTYDNPSANGYDLYMTQGLQFVAKGAVVAKPMLAIGETANGMDLAYNFEGLNGVFSETNIAPADPAQRWAWRSPDNQHPLFTDNYGEIFHTQAQTSSAGGLFPNWYVQNRAFTTPYAEALPGPLTVLNCFGHYPTTLLELPALGAIALKKGADLAITDDTARLGAVTQVGNVVTAIAVAYGGSGYTDIPSVSITGNGVGAAATATLTGGVVTSITVTNGGHSYTQPSSAHLSITSWNVTFLGTSVGNVTIPDNSIGCVVVRRDSSNRVSVYTSSGIGKSLPLTTSATAVVSGAWTTAPLVIGDATNSFWGVESLLRVWSRDLGDDELISEMAAVRGVLWARGKGSAIP